MRIYTEGEKLIVDMEQDMLICKKANTRGYGVQFDKKVPNASFTNGIIINVNESVEGLHDLHHRVRNYIVNEDCDIDRTPDVDRIKRFDFRTDFKFLSILPHLSINFHSKNVEFEWLCFGLYISFAKKLNP